MSTLKQKLVDEASKLAMSPMVLKVLANPSVQKAFLAMLKANSEFSDHFDGKVKSIARGMSLVTREDLGAVRREQRDQTAEVETLIDRVASLEIRVRSLEEAAAAAKKAAAAAAAAARRTPAKKTAAKKTAAKKAASKKTTSRRASKARSSS